MILFLFTSVALAGQPTKRLSDADRGGELYMTNCWMCHGKKGQGNGPASEAFSTESPQIAKTIERKAWERAIRVIMDGRGDMPGYSQVMDKHDVKRILTWLENPKAVKPRPSKVDKKSTKSGVKKAKPSK